MTTGCASTSTISSWGRRRDNVWDAVARDHLGPVRMMAPGQVAEIVARRAAGESWSSIHEDFAGFSRLSTVRMAVRYAADT